MANVLKFADGSEFNLYSKSELTTGEITFTLYGTTLGKVDDVISVESNLETLTISDPTDDTEIVTYNGYNVVDYIKKENNSLYASLLNMDTSDLNIDESGYATVSCIVVQLSKGDMQKQIDTLNTKVENLNTTVAELLTVINDSSSSTTTA